MRVYYMPPKGHTPFVYFFGSEKVFMPPDQYWKKVKQKVMVGVVLKGDKTPKIDQKTGKPMERFQDVKVWVVDKEKNQAMKDGNELPPKNYMDLSDHELRYLGRGDFADFAPYLVSEDKVKGEQRSEYNDLVRDHEKEMAALKRKNAAQKAALEKELLLAEEALKHKASK